ncbi:MAG TPA: hypothetical protein VGX92_18495 [Pyrinomonadaceae bacterium]|jgi:hypothetical protein|nr:hypothetical protein [Pyrinomonadaceae bacterium]
MSRFRRQQSEKAGVKQISYLAPALAFVIIVLAAHHGNGQSPPPPLTLRAGQSMYIVAFRQTQLPLTVDQTEVAICQREYINYDLDAERKVRKRIEEWQFFRVVDKPSMADFIFLVNLDESSIEGLAIPYEAYRQHFKEKFDLDALRDAAYGRYLIGPLKLPTLSRLSDRLVQQFREKLTTATQPRNDDE